jgi:glycosyltransferase involved in cell wall biosynthesis
MKILHVNAFYSPVQGGAEMHLKELSEGLAARGHAVTVLTTNVGTLWDIDRRRCAELPGTDLINGVTVRRMRPNDGACGKALDAWLGMKGGYRSLSTALGDDRLEYLSQGFRNLSMVRAIVAADADIVACMNWYFAPAYHTYLARKVKKFRMVGIPLFHTTAGWCGRPIHSRMLRACDAVIANTQHEADYIRTKGATRVQVAGVGVHPQAFEGRCGGEIRARYGLGHDPVIGFVGRLMANKGATALLQAMKTVWGWNADARLVLAGSIPPGSRELDDVLTGFTEAERNRVVIIRNFTDAEKPSIYDAFDVFALPSTSESFGIAYLEAWLSKKPVIGARAGSTPSVILEGVDGVLVDPTDAEALGSAIIDLLRHPEKSRRLSENGYAKTLAHFTWDKVTDGVERLYQDLVGPETSHRESSSVVGRQQHSST